MPRFSVNSSAHLSLYSRCTACLMTIIVQAERSKKNCHALLVGLHVAVVRRSRCCVIAGVGRREESKVAAMCRVFLTRCGLIKNLQSETEFVDNTSLFVASVQTPLPVLTRWTMTDSKACTERLMWRFLAQLLFACYLRDQVGVRL